MGQSNSKATYIEPTQDSRALLIKRSLIFAVPYWSALLYNLFYQIPNCKALFTQGQFSQAFACGEFYLLLQLIILPPLWLYWVWLLTPVYIAAYQQSQWPPEGKRVLVKQKLRKGKSARIGVMLSVFICSLGLLRLGMIYDYYDGFSRFNGDLLRYEQWLNDHPSIIFLDFRD